MCRARGSRACAVSSRNSRRLHRVHERVTSQFQISAGLTSNPGRRT
jgi:hypothetical protein